MTPSKVPMPQAPVVDLATGFATRPWNNFFNSLTQNANAGTAGSVTTAAGSGLGGGGVVADGISLIIAANGVSNGMIRQSAGYSVIGRAAGSTGNVADITATADDRVLARIGGVLAFWDFSTIPGAGSVTSVSVVTANGVSGTVATATTTPAITLTLGAITPTSVAATAQVSAATYLKSTAKTVAALTAAGTAGAGARDTVTDALGPAFGAAVVGGGAVTVPVYCTGAGWFVG